MLGKKLDLSKPCIMAILNLTPDSFYNHSRICSADDAISKTEQFLSQGATIIDLGAYSSRPNAIHISEKEEIKRILPILEALVNKFPEAIFSVDTFRAKVAELAIQSGANLINDISGGSLDDKMLETVAKFQVPYVMMHIKGTPQNMMQNIDYKNIVVDIYTYFEEKIRLLHQFGISDIIIDIGFGFAKTLSQNYKLLHHLEYFKTLNYPILVGVSRKSMIYKLLKTDANHALNGTTALHTVALLKGAKILRVHDVKEAKECIDLVEKLTYS